MRFRKRLEKRGYILVNKKRMAYLRGLAIQQEDMNREQSVWMTRAIEHEDQIKILEAEIEAHKRVEAVLAQRTMKGGRV